MWINKKYNNFMGENHLNLISIAYEKNIISAYAIIGNDGLQ